MQLSVKVIQPYTSNTCGEQLIAENTGVVRREEKTGGYFIN